MEIADAIDHAHRHGIVHRDLKPGNVMLARTDDPSGAERAVLPDFGLARRLPMDAGPEPARPTRTTPTTRTGAVLGTPAYMAPEQIDGHPADARTDTFAFGALVYEMLTGRPAFEGESAPSVMAAILRADPPSLAHLTPPAPAGLEQLVKTCLAKVPDQRFSSMGEVLRRLGQIVRDPSASPPSAILTGRRVAVAAALAAVLAAVLVVRPPAGMSGLVDLLSPAPALPSIRSVAVLPFADLPRARTRVVRGWHDRGAHRSAVPGGPV